MEMDLSDDDNVIFLTEPPEPPEPRFSVGGRPVSVAVADFNGDELPDLATANSSSGDVSVLLHR